MASVLSFPAPARAIPPASRIDPHIYTFGQVAQQLGISNKKPTWKMGYIRKMIELQAFPTPLPGMNYKRNLLLEGADAVGIQARWQRAAVDAWFDGHLPPGVLATRQSAERSREAEALDANAADLLPGRGRGRS